MIMVISSVQVSLVVSSSYSGDIVIFKVSLDNFI